MNDNGLEEVRLDCKVRINCDMCESEKPAVDLLEEIVYVSYKLKEKIFAEV